MVLFCRLCSTENSRETLRNVFQCTIQHTEDSLVDVLFWIFSIEVDVTDPFSKDICSECIQLIEYILQVRNTFQKNQEILKSQNCSSFEEQPLDHKSIEKVSNNEQSSSYYSTTPTNSPSKSPYNNNMKKNNTKIVYGSSSPRVRVSLSNIEAICPLSINVEPLENTQEYLKYRRLKNGSFKKRKYRYFHLDEAVLDDICSTLEDRQDIKTEPLKMDIGGSTNAHTRNVCTCNKNLASPIEILTNVQSVSNSKRTNRLEKRTDDTSQEFLDIVGLNESVRSTLLSLEDNGDYDWTTLTFRKDASTNTESTTTPTTRNIGINATVCSTTTGTLTKNFKQMRKKNVVKVNIDSLKAFSPIVELEPLENILEKMNYEKIGKFRYIKIDELSSESEAEENLKQSVVTRNLDDSPTSDKKQKYLEFYKNFSSFAVRELINGKQIRENISDCSPVLNVSNVHSLFVCNLCSNSFLSKIGLNMHYKKSHNVVDRESGHMSKGIKRKRTISVKKPTAKSEAVQEDNVINEDWASDVHTDTPTNPVDRKDDFEDSSYNNSAKSEDDQKLNCNTNDTIKHKTNPNQTPVQATDKRRLKNKRNGETKYISYVWDRKRLGKYSAISYYKNCLGEEGSPNLTTLDIQHKQDQALNRTIEKLANRLDSS